MQFVYLVQGSRETLPRQAFGSAPFYTLCYQGECHVEGAAACLHSTTASWAEGRNLLLAAARQGHPDADYYVFCDDDVEFLTGDFAAFEAALATTRPAIGMPLMPKARIGAALDDRLPVQRALDIDEQMYAVHRSVIGTIGIAPLDTQNDHISWYVASLIFEYATSRLLSDRSHQYNTIELVNNGHIWETSETLYTHSRGTPAEFVPVFAARAADLFGHFDERVIEQFMPPLDGPQRAEYDRERRAHLAGLAQFDGSPVEPG